MEATWDWYWVYDPLEGAGLEISLVHPLKAKAIASARIRSDHLDSRILAHLLRSDLLPCAYIPSRGTRERRELLRYRVFPSLRSRPALSLPKGRALLSPPPSSHVLEHHNRFACAGPLIY